MNIPPKLERKGAQIITLEFQVVDIKGQRSVIERTFEAWVPKNGGVNGALRGAIILLNDFYSKKGEKICAAAIINGGQREAIPGFPML